MIKRQGKDSTVDPAYIADTPKVTTFIEELPPVTAEDNGKVLSVVEGAWDKAAPTEELPPVTAEDNGKVLSVVEGEWNKTTPTGGLPEVTAEDNGKVLQVVDGEWSKGTSRKPVAVYIPSDDPDGGAPAGMELKKCISYIEGGIYHLMAEMYVPSGTVFRRNSGETTLLAASRTNLLIDYPSGDTTGILFNVGYAGQIVKKNDLDNPRESAAPIKLQMGGGTNGIVYIRLDLTDDTTYTVESGYEYFYIEAKCFVRTT